MNGFKVFLFEWKHFIRSPFKVVAVLLFIVAAVYGLHNGNSLYQAHTSQIEKIELKAEEERQKYLTRYEEGELTDENRPWIDMSSPFWAIWCTPTHTFKQPSPAMVYSIGQAEQYGFYKRVTFWASTFDADMAEEIANPERLQTSTLDFAFALLFLLPLLLLILLYNLKSTESESGFLRLVEVQATTTQTWLLYRIAFYISLTILVLLGLLLYGASLTSLFEQEREVFGKIILLSGLYPLFWTVLFYLVLRKGKTIMGNTLVMVSFWLLFCFVIPGVVHQMVGISKPVNLMTDVIGVRDQQEELYSKPDSLFQEELNRLFPFITDSKVYKSSDKTEVMNESGCALINEMNKNSILSIETENLEKNAMIKSTFWFNPITFFQNELNAISETHYVNYAEYRNEIQSAIDKRIGMLVQDLWSGVKVDREKYLQYNEEL